MARFIPLDCMGVCALAVSVVAACTFNFDLASRDGGAGDDGAVVDGPNGIDATVIIECTDWGSVRHIDPCDMPVPAATLMLTTAGVWTIDTDTGQLHDPGGTLVDHSGSAVALDQADEQPGSAYVISALDVAVAEGAELRATGSRPLVVASWNALTVSGRINVSSERAGDRGAGADPNNGCVAAGTGQSVAADGGGGGGGGFGSVGGNGGPGDNDTNGGQRGDVSADPHRARGGCPGGKGGGNAGGQGSAGGGALLLVARTSISVAGTLSAGGAGGVHSGGEAGGGGAGSGGLIDLDAPTVTILGGAITAANGGGGGAGRNGAEAYTDSSDALDSDLVAPGGTAGVGGNGGEGATGSDSAKNGRSGVQVDQQGGGGGGGGGIGVVYSHASSLGVDVDALRSPAITFDVCELYCKAMIAPDCPAGPASPSGCETSCNSKRVGPCATEQQELLACSVGRSAVCDGDRPSIVGCEAQQSIVDSCTGG